LTPHWKENNIWDVTIRVSRYVDKAFKKIGSKGQFGFGAI